MRNGRPPWWSAIVGALLALVIAHPAEAAEVAARPQSSPTFDDNVLAVAYRGSVIFVGGRFTTAWDGGAEAGRSRLAAVDGRTGRLLDWIPRTDGAVQAMAVHGDSLYVAGDFGRVNGKRRSGIAKLDAITGELDPDFAPVVSGRVLELAVGHGRLYLGGSVRSVNGQPRHHAAAVDLESGEVDTRWAPVVERNVHSIAVDSSRVYLAGLFSELNGSGDYRKLAAVDPVTGATDTGFRSRLSVIARDVTVTSGTVYAAVGGVGGRLIAFGSDGTQRWSVSANGDFQAVTVLGDTVYAGGHFSTICTTPRTGTNGACLDGSTGRNRLAAFDLSGNLRGWAPEADSAVGVQVMEADSSLGTVVVGGAFTTVGGVAQPHFARFT